MTNNTEAPKQYAERDARGLGDFYLTHVMAMTVEGLHSKSDIAAELAFRDRHIKELESTIATLRQQIEAAQKQEPFGFYNVKYNTFHKDTGVGLPDCAAVNELLALYALPPIPDGENK
jgi:hypothetical protein